MQGIGKVIKCTTIQPASGMEKEFDRWYRKEHLEQVSRMEGWRKSTRYEAVFWGPPSQDEGGQKENRPSRGPPQVLAIHEFEEGTVVRRMKEHEWTEWTRRMVNCAVEIEEGVFEFVSLIGDKGAGL